MDSTHQYIADLHRTIDELKKENAKLKKKIRGKGKGIKAETKDARREWMAQTWERGALNYHRSKEYKKMERPENREDLLAYHAEFPDAEMGDVYRVLKGLPSLASAELARKNGTTSVDADEPKKKVNRARASKKAS